MEGIANPGRGRGGGRGRGRGKGHGARIFANSSDIPPLLDYHHNYENYGNRGGGNIYNNRGGRHVPNNENYQQQEQHQAGGQGRGCGGNRWRNSKRGGHVVNSGKINVNHGIENNIEHHGEDHRHGFNENDHGKEVLPRSIPDHNENRKQFERKGPVFGFKRLHGFLSSPQHTVILSIKKDKLDWEDFLNSDQINPSNPRNNLHLIMQVLVEKVISGGGEPAPKIDICAPTIVENFRKSIVEQCLQIMMSQTPKKSAPPPLIRNLKGTFIEIDKSPETFLRNLVTYFVFVINFMLPKTIEFFPSLITNAIGAVSWLSKSNPGFNTSQILRDCRSLMHKLQLYSLDPHEQTDETDTCMDFQIGLKQVEDNVRSPPGSGGGLPKCNAILPCSHHCEKVSHTKDPGHQKYSCKKPCLISCLNDHPCRSVCFKKCPPCQVTMVKTLPQCGHAAEMLCCENPAEYVCKILMNRKLPCGHEADLACHLDPTEYTCKAKMSRILPCQEHQQILECHVDPGSQTCKINVEKKLPCGHWQNSECHLSPDVIKCKTKVQITLVDCGHTLDVPCIEQTNKKLLICRNPCSIRLSCDHSCPKICQHTSTDPVHSDVPCKKNCSRACKAGHQCSLIHKCDTPCPPCKTFVLRNLACGHQKELPCHVDPTQYKCIEPCTRRFPCSHTCENLCFEMCGPCTAVVEKYVPSCLHRILVTCSVQPTQAMCMQLVKPMNRSLCGHDVKVPCKIRNTVDAAQVTALCTEPCSDLLSTKLGGCGHPCKGTCSSCWQGRLHAKCGVECGRILICGDVCDFPCSNHGCPPCNKKCHMKCEHSECGEQCGTPCLDCNERCSWQCVHKRCTKFCRELCDRSPCDEPCRKLLRCGHPCVGFCGEPCPPHCRKCDSEQLTGFILSGREKDENSRFIFLPDCKHSIEVEGLTKHINSTTNQFGSKKCPRCHTRINYCRRFNNVIRAEVEDVIVERDILFGDYEAVKNIHRQVIEKLKCHDTREKLVRNFPIFYNHLVNQVVDIIPASISRIAQLGVFGQRGGNDMDSNERWIEKKVNEQVLKSISFLVGCAETGVEVLIQGRNASREKGSLTSELSAKLHTRYIDLFVNIQNRKLPLSRMEMRDISRELSRLSDLCDVYLGRSNPKYKDTNPRAFQFYVKALRIVEEQGPYLGLRKSELNILLKKLEEVLRHGLEISAAERQQILATFASTGQGTPGLWYKCRFGQYYEIVEEHGAGAALKCDKCDGQVDFDSENTTSTSTTLFRLRLSRDSDLSYQLLSRLTGTTERELRQMIFSTVLSSSSTHYQDMSTYFANTQCHNFNVRITNIFKIRRFDDVNCFGGGRANRKLLWHGTKLTNVGGILSRGFSRPSHGGQMFGTGTYFADRASKSIQYCGVSRASRGSKGYLFVCAVALGNSHIASSANHSFQAPPSGYDSIMGVGQSVPDVYGRRMYLDAEIPCGKTVQTTQSSSGLLYNEYIVYDMDRITIKFLLEFEIV